MATVGIFEFSAEIWRHPGASGWYFVSLPSDVSADITDLTAGSRRGFGSVPVAATVGGTVWRTSIFPDRSRGTYLLPVKQGVRAAERLDAGDQAQVTLELADLQNDRAANR